MGENEMMVPLGTLFERVVGDDDALNSRAGLADLLGRLAHDLHNPIAAVGFEVADLRDNAEQGGDIGRLRASADDIDRCRRRLAELADATAAAAQAIGQGGR